MVRAFIKNIQLLDGGRYRCTDEYSTLRVTDIITGKFTSCINTFVYVNSLSLDFTKLKRKYSDFTFYNMLKILIEG